MAYEKVDGVFVDERLTEDAGTTQINASRGGRWADDRYEAFEYFLNAILIRAYGYKNVYFDFDEKLKSGTEVYSGDAKIKNRFYGPTSDVTLYLEVGKIDDQKSEIHFKCNTLPFVCGSILASFKWFSKHVPKLENK